MGSCSHGSICLLICDLASSLSLHKLETRHLCLAVSSYLVQSFNIVIHIGPNLKNRDKRAGRIHVEFRDDVLPWRRHAVSRSAKDEDTVCPELTKAKSVIIPVVNPFLVH
jgi:hypothetical protein